LSYTIKARFTASLIANILRSGVSFITGMLLARWMGPVDYGRMAFLLASFMAFRQLLDMASSSAFFTFLSQRPRSRYFVNLYWRWIGLQFLISLILVWFLLPDGSMEYIWKGEKRGVVLLAFVATFMQGVVWPIASQMAEAQRETVRAQRLNTLMVLFHLGVVLVLWWVGQLAIPLLLVAIALEWGAAGWFTARMYQDHNSQSESEAEFTETVATVWREFWHYCLPFVPYTFLGFAHDFADRWMLQRWGGATEQAYYSVAFQFSAVALLATSSILRIFWKEIAEAHHRRDNAKVEQLYFKVSRGLYFVGAVVAGGLMPWTSEIIKLTLGKDYYGGALTLMLMFLYPVHQSMGQIGGTMLYATGHTRIQVMLGLVFMATSLAGAYFMMAPSDAIIPGLALASQGLAYKMVIIQFVQVNIVAWAIARVFKWTYDFGYQIVSLSIALTIGWLVKTLVTGWLEASTITVMMLAIPIYIALIASVLYYMPGLAGIRQIDILQVLSSARRFINSNG
jgi:O-antigen/teichoic acid export membrane protein